MNASLCFLVFISIVDDGTGVITCCKWKKKPEEEEYYSGITLGMLVKVDGKIRIFREERQINVEMMSILFSLDIHNVCELLHRTKASRRLYLRCWQGIFHQGALCSSYESLMKKFN